MAVFQCPMPMLAPLVPAGFIATTRSSSVRPNDVVSESAKGFATVG